MSVIANIIVTVVVALLVKILYLDSPSALLLANKLNSSYDYIVVGAGSAGSVVANRLSEDGQFRVLLLEAGYSDLVQPNINIPILGATLIKTHIDWEYYTESQDGILTGLKENRSVWPRGKVLGGSSSTNGMQYVRGSRHDFDRWALYTQDSGWDYKHVLPYFLKSEDVRIPELSDSEYHAHGGPLTINQINLKGVMFNIIQAAKTIGYHENEDFNGKTMEGISHSQATTRNGERWSTSRAFLYPALGRPNLDVAIHSHVTKIIIQNKTAVGVEVIKDGRKYVVNARKEIILSAGAVGSPQILMLSGIGPKKHLDNLKIPVVTDLPVGENLQDHLMYDIGIKITEPLTATWTNFMSFWSILQYKLFGTGHLSSPFKIEGLAFKSTTEETREKGWPDLQIHFMCMPDTTILMDVFNYADHTKAELSERNSMEYGFTCLPNLLRPESRGSITLRSSDPFDYPIIKANYLEKQEDIEVLIRGINECKKLADTKPMKDIGAELTEKTAVDSCKQHKFDSHEYWTCMIKQRPLTVYHPVGTCKMGPIGDLTAVVDSELKVQGLSGIRVADASVMPWITSGNTNAPSIMIGEKVSDLIRGKTPLKPLNL
uniref:Glucose-methanol-choline oxidoreductase N-terminal domain-containing protein n=1 Tax=Arion vulgaris TaxID=1028688 RepID=A0A0B7BFL3_9EUPU